MQRRDHHKVAHVHCVYERRDGIWIVESMSLVYREAKSIAWRRILSDSAREEMRQPFPLLSLPLALINAQSMPVLTVRSHDGILFYTLSLASKPPLMYSIAPGSSTFIAPEEYIMPKARPVQLPIADRMAYITLTPCFDIGTEDAGLSSIDLLNIVARLSFLRPLAKSETPLTRFPEPDTRPTLSKTKSRGHGCW